MKGISSQGYEWTLVLAVIILDSTTRTMTCQQVAYIWVITAITNVGKCHSGVTLANYALPGDRSLLESLYLTCYVQNITRSTLEASTICSGSNGCRAITRHGHACECPIDPVLKPSQARISWQHSYLRMQEKPLPSKHLKTSISSEASFNASFKQSYC